MIVNECAISKEDVAFLVSRGMKTPQKKVLRVILLLVGIAGCGIGLFGIWLIVRAKRVHLELSGVQWAVIEWSVFGILGLLFFFFGDKIAYWRAMHSKAWKAMIGSPVKNVLDGESITVSRSTVGTDTQSKFAYSLIISFADCNNTLYLCVKADNQKKYIILHDDGYREGTKADVLALLHSRGIPQENPN